MTIRSTRNESIKTVSRSTSGHRSESRETTWGSSNGVAAAVTVELTEAEYDAAIGNEYGPIHANEYWGESGIKR